MQSIVADTLAHAEERASVSDYPGTLTLLRSLSLDDFGLLTINLPDPTYPNISRLLPRMASREDQVLWTGASGAELLQRSVAFIRSVELGWRRRRQLGLDKAKVLDFGCGYGRLLRLFEYFSDRESLYGCDPWINSIEACQQNGIHCTIRQSEYVPEALPFDAALFDLIYAFSVFSHLSQRAANASFGALAKVAKPSALLFLTIFPVEFWDSMSHLGGPGQGESYAAMHQAEGFAFRPHDRLPPVDGDVSYGDASMTLETLALLAADWTIVGTAWNLCDPLQRVIVLERRPRLGRMPTSPHFTIGSADSMEQV
jgi:SAM-dependent methyltransferase